MVHRDFVPNEDATVVARLKQASAMLLGKLEMTEGGRAEDSSAARLPDDDRNRRILDRYLFERPGSCDGVRALLRRACLRHWRINPLAVRRDWLVGNQAIVGTR
jgi:hypothetical protein